MRPATVPRLLALDDHLTDFSSGELAPDEWLKKRALANQTSGASRTYITTNANRRVVGYYSLSNGSVQNRSAPGRVRRNQPDPVPVILLGRLAVDAKEQHQGLGSQLLRDAITHAVQAADVVGVRALQVHALNDEARNFYLNFDFEPSPTDGLHLLLLMQDARASVVSLSDSR